MTRPAPNKTPAWTGRSVPLLSEEGFAEALERLEAKIVALEALAKTPPKGAAALGDLVRMADEARDLGVSLRTVCRARQSSNAADTLPGTWLSSVKRLSFRLEEASGGILSAVRELPDEVRARAPFEAWLSPLAVRGSQSSSLFEAVMLPLGSQQSHLVATMKLRIPSEDGHMISLSYAQATSVLKTSPDNRFRRSVFALFNAWFAEHSAAFADLLNAVLGWKLHEAHAAGRDFMTAAFEADRITPAAQLAMMKALELRRENARLTITERARLLGERQLHVTQILGSVEGMHASAPEGLNGLDEVCGSLSSAMACTDPAFGRYLEEALENHWIDARSMSQRAGGTWCEDLPAYNATAVFSTLPSGTAGAFQFAHPLGVGFMHKAQHGEQAPLKRLPYSVIEIFGQLAVTMLERHMARKLEGSTEADLLRWQLMRRASNMLLMVPSRHKLQRRPVGRKTRRHPLGEQVQRGEPPCLGRIFRRHDRRMRPVRLVLETSSLPHKHGLLRLAVRLRLPGLAASRRDLSDVGHHGFGRLARRLREGRLQNALRRAHQKAPRRGHSRPRVLDAGDRHRARPVRTFACRDRSSPITHGPDLSERMEHPGQCISLAFVRPADKKRESPGKKAFPK